MNSPVRPFAAEAGLEPDLTALGAAHMLRLIDVAREALGEDLTNTRIFLKVVAENLKAHAADWRTTVPFSGVQTAPPDRLRIATPLRQLAYGLGLPYETVRRRVRHLRDAELCEIGPNGVLVSSRVLTNPRTISALLKMHQCNLELVAVARRPSRSATAQTSEHGDIRRHLARLASVYFLDVCDAFLLGERFDPTSMQIALFILKARGGGADPAGVLGHSQPHAGRVSTYLVAKQLALPYETVRRHVRAMCGAGLLSVGQHDELFLRTTGEAAPLVNAILLELAEHTRTLLDRLAALGLQA